MTTKSRIERLTTLRNRIAGMQLVRCRMAHERVVAGAVPPAQFSEEGLHFHGFRRVGLCSPEVRAERLGCSHTMARTVLDEAICELDANTATLLGNELNFLTNEIHLLDHRKGEAEARVAAAVQPAEDGFDLPDSPGELNEIEQMGQQHDGYVDRIGLLRGRVISALDTVIGELHNPEAT